jgi:hypothetical protein
MVVWGSQKGLAFRHFGVYLACLKWWTIQSASLTGRTKDGFPSFGQTPNSSYEYYGSLYHFMMMLDRPTSDSLPLLGSASLPPSIKCQWGGTPSS